MGPCTIPIHEVQTDHQKMVERTLQMRMEQPLLEQPRSPKNRLPLGQ